MYLCIYVFTYLCFIRSVIENQLFHITSISQLWLEFLVPLNFVCVCKTNENTNKSKMDKTTTNLNNKNNDCLTFLIRKKVYLFQLEQDQSCHNLMILIFHWWCYNSCSEPSTHYMHLSLMSFQFKCSNPMHKFLSNVFKPIRMHIGLFTRAIWLAAHAWFIAYRIWKQMNIHLPSKSVFSLQMKFDLLFVWFAYFSVTYVFFFCCDS